MSKLYKIERHHVLYVRADSAEEAAELAEEDMAAYEEYTDSEPEEVGHVDTGLGFALVPDDDDDEAEEVEA